MFLNFINLFLFLFIPNLLLAQNSYQKGWDYLNNADFDNAMIHFEKATKDKKTKDQADIVLTLLYTAIDNKEKASTYFNDFYDTNPDPFSELFALWFDEGVVGVPQKHKSYQLNLLKKIESDTRSKNKFDEIVKYRLLSHYIFAYDTLKIAEYKNKMTSIQKWSLLGPFDNMMNSGFNKDFGAVKYVDNNHVFKSRYGADIHWFSPVECLANGYFIKAQNFLCENSIVYAQSFVESESEQDVIMNFGYTGSLKVWLNDSLAYAELNKRETEMDYFQVKCHLNKGFNRVLVQLGDYDVTYANFILRFTDLEHKTLILKNTAEVNTYQKNKVAFSTNLFFAIENLQNKAKQNPDDIIYQIMLAKTFMRANDLDAAEEIINQLFDKYPKNYLVLRQAISFYKQSGNATTQNKVYEFYKEIYPNDLDVYLNDIKEALDKKDKNLSKELINKYRSRYSSEYKNLLYDISLAGFDEDVDKIITKTDEIYKKYPNDYSVVILKYTLQKALNNNTKEANSYLENYLKENYAFQTIETLANNYLEQGRLDDAINILEKSKVGASGSVEIDKKIINILGRKREYDKAKEICNKIVEKRPSDYYTLSDLAIINSLQNDKKTAAAYYEEALRFFPFSFEYNEKVREFKGQKNPYDLKEVLNVNEIIADYEKSFTSKQKKPYDVVLDKKILVIYKSKAIGSRRIYVLKINQESAIEDWQKIDLSPDANMSLQLNQAKTIKKNGNKLDAERNDDNLVFTNLEVGDYVFLDYTQKQNNGGKSSLFVNDIFGINSFNPTYKVNYSVFAEEGIVLHDTIINSSLRPQISTQNGFKKYVWEATNPEVLKDETNRIPFSDIGSVVHLSLNDTWSDIAQWYSDLSGQQAQPDFTIYQIVKELFEGKSYSDEQKAKIIYDFVCKNIQYSSIDFRQSNIIPQKASDVYHTRLGDCKDMSTLYASIARAAGLDVNLILINTRDNGKKNVLLPSLNFNHCIVRLHLKNGSKYLELTDPELPYAYLNYYHNESSILEIPTTNLSKNVTLTFLKLNEGYKNKIVRNTEIKVNANNSLNVKIDVLKIGAEAAATCKTYYNEEDESNKDELKKSISAIYKSAVKINTLDFVKLQPRADTANFKYEFIVENEVSKVGSFKTINIPFSDVLAKLNIFEESERTYEFDYNTYEPVDYYEENFIVNLENPLKILEIPENVNLSFKGNIYHLGFEKINDQQIKISRTYNVERKNIDVNDFQDFKTFITKIIEAENTSLVFK